MKKTQKVFICQNILCSWKSCLRERFISEWSPELPVLVCCIIVFPAVTGSEVTLCGHVILDKHSKSNYCSGLRGDLSEMPLAPAAGARALRGLISHSGFCFVFSTVKKPHLITLICPMCVYLFQLCSFLRIDNRGLTEISQVQRALNWIFLRFRDMIRLCACVCAFKYSPRSPVQALFFYFPQTHASLRETQFLILHPAQT